VNTSRVIKPAIRRNSIACFATVRFICSAKIAGAILPICPMELKIAPLVFYLISKEKGMNMYKKRCRK